MAISTLHGVLTLMQGNMDADAGGKWKSALERRTADVAAFFAMGCGERSVTGGGLGQPSRGAAS